MSLPKNKSISKKIREKKKSISHKKGIILVIKLLKRQK